MYGRVDPILNLGDLSISNFIDSADGEQQKAPLELILCRRCGLLQLRHTVYPFLLYRNYWYKSGINKTMREALKDIAMMAEDYYPLSRGDIVIDVGCNDGTLLRSYRTDGLNTVGFEPAQNLVKEAEVGTTQIINDFFGRPYIEQFKGQAKVITSIAMFYDLDDPNAFVRDVKDTLAQDGIWIIQMAYLSSMLEKNAFDNICHEHLEYYSLLSLRYLLNRHGFEIFSVELNDVNGGSFRVYVRHKSSKSGNLDGSVDELVKKEVALRLDRKEIYEEFHWRILEIRTKVRSFIEAEHMAGKKIYVYGASTKGNTLLQYFNLGYGLITAAVDRNPEKWGKKTVGTQIPIISEEQARREKPDYFLVLPWHFLKEFTDRERDFLTSGGKFIVPLPQFRIISKEVPAELISGPISRAKMQRNPPGPMEEKT